MEVKTMCVEKLARWPNSQLWMENIGFILQFVADIWIIACHLIEVSPLYILEIQVREAMSSLPELSKLELRVRVGPCCLFSMAQVRQGHCFGKRSAICQ